MISDYFRISFFLIFLSRAFTLLHCSLSETFFTDWMKGHTNCRYCSRRWNTTSCISQMRLFKQPCQKCSTASIQLRFISKQDSMSLRLPWWEANEDILLFHNNAHTIENFVYILQRKTLRWTRYSLGLKPFLLFRFQPFF